MASTRRAIINLLYASLAASKIYIYWALTIIGTLNRDNSCGNLIPRFDIIITCQLLLTGLIVTVAYRKSLCNIIFLNYVIFKYFIFKLNFTQNRCIFQDQLFGELSSIICNFPARYCNTKTKDWIVRLTVKAREPVYFSYNFKRCAEQCSNVAGIHSQ